MSGISGIFLVQRKKNRFYYFILFYFILESTRKYQRGRGAEGETEREREIEREREREFQAGLTLILKCSMGLDPLTIGS